LEYWTQHRDTFNKCLALDWFEFFGLGDFSILVITDFKKMKVEEWTVSLTSRCFVVYCGHGTSTFEKAFNVHLDEQLVGQIYITPRLMGDNFQRESIGFKMANHLFYVTDWLHILNQVITELKITFNNITRLDIALDGANHLDKFVACYLADSISNKEQSYITMQGRINIDALKYSEKDYNFNGYVLGSRKSDKIGVIYHKSKEIKESLKTYIKDYWKQCGIDSDFENMIRFEIRLKSKLLKDYTLQDLEKLKNVNHLVSVFAKHAQSFIDFRYRNNNRISRCSALALIEYATVKLENLCTSEIKQVTQLYKAKMSIHSAFYQMTIGIDNDDNEYTKYKHFIENTVANFGLEEWYFQRLEKWKKIYRCNKLTGHVYELLQNN
jgi:hypothetical protein